LKTGRPIINPEARYGTAAGVSVMPGPGGGHVWPPWSFNPNTGLVYIPSQIGGGYNYQANPNFVPAPVDVGPTGRGQFNMGTGGGGGGGRGGGGRGGAGGAGGAAAAPPPGVDPGAIAAGAGRGAAPAAAPAAAGDGRFRGNQPAIPTIGPTG